MDKATGSEDKTEDSPVGGPEVKPAAGASAAEERCPICLEDFQDKAFVDACFHTFCFECVIRWAEATTTSCPMCKTVFSKVIHNVRDNDDYDVFKVIPKPSNSDADVEIIDVETALRNFRGYRTTRLPGQPSTSQPSTSSGSIARPHPLRHGRRPRTHRRESRKPAAIQRRRAVYSIGLRALPLTRERTGARPLRIRDISASFFRSNPAATHRLYPWLHRELEVLVGEEHVQFVTQLIVSVIDKVDLQSEEFPSYLEPYLHEKTEHFMHEFISFALSPYDMIAYDNNVSYDWPSNHPENRPREHGGPQDPTPSTSSDIQQRILDELTSTGWDDSPPILETTSPSYLDHSSDSDFEGQGSEGDSNIVQTRPLVSETVGVTAPEQSVNQELDSQRATSETIDDGDIASIQADVQDTVDVDVEKEEHVVVDLTGEPGSTFSPQSLALPGLNLPPQEDSAMPKTEDCIDDEISLYAENDLTRELAPEGSEDNTSTSTRRRKDTLVKHGPSARRSRDKNRHPSRNDERKEHSRRHSKSEKRKVRDRSPARERSKSSRTEEDKFHQNTERSRSRSHKHSDHRHRHKHSSPVHLRHKHDSYDRERWSDEDSTYYRRSEGHRSKLYSDEVEMRSSFDRRKDHHGSASSGKSSQTLSHELNGLEREISNNKRDLLKSMLRRERIELLRRSLYPQQYPVVSSVEVPTSLQCSNGDASVEDMQRELQSLDGAIVDGKKHLLRVMKKIEEDQLEDSDHDGL